MARGRRFGRLLATLAVLLLVLLLLELNRFLPGSWPGGGGDAGSRRTETTTVREDRVRPPDPPPETPDASRAPTATIRVEAADGTPVAGGTLRPVGGGPPIALAAEATPLPPGAARGFEVAVSGLRVLRAPPSRAARGPVVLRLPAARPGDPAPVAAREVTVLGRGGAPLPGAHVTATGPDGVEAVLPVDARGRTRLPEREGTFRVCASARDHGEACLHAVARGGPIEIRLPETVRVATEFRDPETGEALRATALRIVSADGAVRPLPRREGGRTDYSEEAPADRVRTESLEVEVEGRAPLRVPLASVGATTAVPRGREVTVRATGPDGAPVEGARVTTTFSPREESEAETMPPVRQERATDAQGRASVFVPEDRPAVVLVEPEDLAPASAVVRPGAPGETRVTLEPGVRLSVRVLDAAGAPVRAADVVVLARAGSVPSRRAASTGDDGTVSLPPVAAGTAEVYAHCPGCAWGFARVEVAPGVPPLVMRLAAGRPLRVVVEDPLGVPLPGVRVRAVARADREAGRPEILGPDERPWTTDDAGALLVDDLPDRDVDLYLTKPGLRDETLVRVRPGDVTWFATMVPE